jgi:dipeptidyl aminopeptidase/acylaminoacyl peptidase
VLHALLASVLLGGVSNAAESRFALDDVYRIVGVSSPRISPDRKSLLFVRSHVNLDRDKREGELVVLDIKTRAQRVLQAPDTVDDPQWSPDGTSITFLAEDSEHHSQVYLTWPDAGTPEQITHAKSGVDSYAWRPDGKAIAYVAFDPVPERTGIAKWQDAYRVTDNGYMQTGPFPPAHLWLATETQSQEVWAEHRLTSGSWSVAAGSAQSTISWSPDGKALTFVRLPNALLGDAERSVVEKLDVARGESAQLTGRSRYEFNPRFSPNGAYIAYTYARDGDPMNEADIFLSTGRGAGVDITRRGLDANATNYTWSPDSRALYVQTRTGTQSVLWRVGVDGHVQRIPLGDVNVLGDLDGSIASDGSFAFVGTTSQHPGEIYYRSASGSLQRLTDYNAWIASKPLGKVASLNWTNDGFREDGVLTYPAGYQPKQRYPLVLLIHGGPTSASLTSFDELAQIMSARGWFVLRPNYRGSDNLGNAYQHAIYIDATRGPGRDILAGVAAVQRTVRIDPRKICVSGWSYGGMMTSWLITQDHRWACAVSGAAVNDLVYDYSLADDISADRESMPGSPFVGKNMAAYRAVSPLNFYRNVRTPTLILSDMYDNRVPIAQSYAFYHALRDIGAPVQFYVWPVHGHFPSDPVRTVDVYRYWIDWIAKHVK